MRNLPLKTHKKSLLDGLIQFVSFQHVLTDYFWLYVDELFHLK